MVFSEINGRPKSMKLSNFNWSANDVSRKFQGSKTLDNFIAKYLELFGDAGEQSADVASDTQPPKKRVKLSTQSHKALLPASRNRELLQAQGGDHSDDDGQYEEASMDKLIHNHFRGLLTT